MNHNRPDFQQKAGNVAQSGISERPDYSDYEIVGFDGTPKIECGRSLPILRHRSTDTYGIPLNAAASPTDLSTFTRGDFSSWATEGRITKLPKPIPSFHQAVALYIRADFLKQGRLSLRSIAPKMKLHWQALPETSPPAWATIVPSAASTALLDNWAAHFRDLSTRLLERHLASPDENKRRQAESAAQVARAAAVTPRLRSEVLLRHGLAVFLSPTPERLNTITNIIVRKELPQWRPDDFMALVRYLRDLLSARTPPQAGTPPSTAAASPHSSARRHKHDQLPSARTWAEAIQVRKEIKAMELEQQVPRARDLARIHYSLRPPTKAQTDRLTDLVFSADRPDLEDTDLDAINVEPATYLPEVLLLVNGRPYLDVDEFWAACGRFPPPTSGDQPLTMTDRCRELRLKPHSAPHECQLT